MPTSRKCWMQARCLQIIAQWSGIKVVSLVAWFIILENSRKLPPSTYLGSSLRIRGMLHGFLVWGVQLNLLLKLVTSLCLGHLWIPSLELLWSQPAVLILLHACGASSTEGNLCLSSLTSSFCNLIFGGSNLIWHWIWKSITFVAQLIYALKPKRRLHAFNIQPADLWLGYSTTAATWGTRSWRLRWVAGKFSTGAGVIAHHHRIKSGCMVLGAVLINFC